MSEGKQSSRAMLFIVLTVLIDGLGIGLIIPVMPSLIQTLGAGSISDAATWGGILATVFAIMQFVFGPILGSLSDAHGRRLILLGSLTITTFNYLLMSFATSLAMLFLARLIGGSASATGAAASAYVADISAPEEKTKRFGYIGAAFGAGFIFGPTIGGFLGEMSPQAPFFGAALLAACNTIYGFFVLPESLSKENRRPFSWKNANPISAIRSMAKFPFLRRVLVIYFIYSIGFNVLQSVWAYYGQLRFGWTPQTLGISIGLFGLGTVIVQAVLLRPVIKHLGERLSIILAFGCDILVFTMLAFIENGQIVLFFAPLASIGAIARPALQGVMSKRVSDSEQGVLQGVFTSVTSLATIVAPLMMTQVFAQFSIKGTEHYFPGAPFILSSVLLSICLILAITTKAPPMPLEGEPTIADDENDSENVTVLPVGKPETPIG